MIIVNLKGGLGNQMFQYACGKAISIECNQKFKLSDHSYTANPDREYELYVFNIKSEIAKPKELEKIKYPLGILSKSWRFIMGRLTNRYSKIHFDQKVLKCKKNLFLDGYFQSEKYFKKYRKEILEDFSLKVELGSDAQKSLNLINEDKNSVSINFRRTDFINHPDFDLNDNEYQLRAIKKIKELVDNPNFYIFSDDINWVKNNIKLPKNTTHISNPEIKDYEELILMSNCKHNIIQNSTFAWWSAWLNKNPEKIIIAPKMWSNGKYNNNFRDIVPKKWIRV